MVAREDAEHSDGRGSHDERHDAHKRGNFGELREGREACQEASKRCTPGHRLTSYHVTE